MGAVEAAAATVRAGVGSRSCEARVRACLAFREATSFSALSISSRSLACRSSRILESRASWLARWMACWVSHACSSDTDSSSSAGGVVATGGWAAVVSAGGGSRAGEGVEGIVRGVGCSDRGVDCHCVGRGSGRVVLVVWWPLPPSLGDAGPQSTPSSSSVTLTIVAVGRSRQESEGRVRRRVVVVDR